MAGANSCYITLCSDNTAGAIVSQGLYHTASHSCMTSISRCCIASISDAHHTFGILSKRLKSLTCVLKDPRFSSATLPTVNFQAKPIVSMRSCTQNAEFQFPKPTSIGVIELLRGVGRIRRFGFVICDTDNGGKRWKSAVRRGC